MTFTERVKTVKRLLTFLLLIAITTPLAAQAVILDVSGAKPGKYYYQLNVAPGGIVTVSPLSQVIRLTDPTPGPQPQPDPDDLTARALQIKNAALAVTSDDQRGATAAALAALYREIATKIGDGTVKGQEAGAFMVKTGSDMLLTARKSREAWSPVRSLLTQMWSTLAQEGATDADYARLLQEAATGLEASCADEDPQIDIAMIIQIVKLVLELLEKFFP